MLLSNLERKRERERERERENRCAVSKSSPLKLETIEPVVEWKKGMQRTGLIAKKIGIYPLWLKNGRKVSSTLFQVK